MSGGEGRQSGEREAEEGRAYLKRLCLEMETGVECLNVLVYVRSQVVKCPQPILTDCWRGLGRFIKRNTGRTSDGVPL